MWEDSDSSCRSTDSQLFDLNKWHFALGRILVLWSRLKINYYPAGGQQQIFIGPPEGFIRPSPLLVTVRVEPQGSAGCSSHSRSKWQEDFKCFAKHWWNDFTSKSDVEFLFKLQIEAPCLLDCRYSNNAKGPAESSWPFGLLVNQRS